MIIIDKRKIWKGWNITLHQIVTELFWLLEKVAMTDGTLNNWYTNTPFIGTSVEHAKVFACYQLDASFGSGECNTQ